MSLDAYLNRLQALSRLRSISVNARGVITTSALVDPEPANALSLDLQIDPAIRLATPQCHPFDATTHALPVPLTLAAAGPLIDPERWGEFCDIRTEGAVKDSPPRPDGWSGTIDERIRVKVGPIVTNYHNRLRIDYQRGAAKAQVDFELLDSFAGELAFERGFLRLQPDPSMKIMALVCSKTLLYRPASPWCQFPASILSAILRIWVSASTAEYAFRMVQHAAGVDPSALEADLLDQACSMLPTGAPS